METMSSIFVVQDSDNCATFIFGTMASVGRVSEGEIRQSYKPGCSRPCAQNGRYPGVSDVPRMDVRQVFDGWQDPWVT